MKTIILILVGAAGLAEAGDWKADFLRRYVVIQPKPTPKPAVVDPEVLKQAIIQPVPTKPIKVIPLSPETLKKLMGPPIPTDAEIAAKVWERAEQDAAIARIHQCEADRRQEKATKAVVDAIEAKTAEVLDELSAMRRAEEVRRLEQPPVIIIRGK